MISSNTIPTIFTPYSIKSHNTIFAIFEIISDTFLTIDIPVFLDNSMAKNTGKFLKSFINIGLSLKEFISCLHELFSGNWLVINMIFFIS